jgi:uncharacterized membrane protein YjfL (UPF0719 family)
MIGLLKLFFNPRMLEWFIVAGVATLLNFFIVYMYTLPTLIKMIKDMNTAS